MTAEGHAGATFGRSKENRPFRCPYCVEGREFKLMLAHKSDECYMCMNCGHLAMANHPEFQCPCVKCAGLSLRVRRRPV